MFFYRELRGKREVHDVDGHLISKGFMVWIDLMMETTISIMRNGILCAPAEQHDVLHLADIIASCPMHKIGCKIN